MAQEHAPKGISSWCSSLIVPTRLFCFLGWWTRLTGVTAHKGYNLQVATIDENLAVLHLGLGQERLSLSNTIIQCGPAFCGRHLSPRWSYRMWRQACCGPLMPHTPLDRAQSTAHGVMAVWHRVVGAGLPQGLRYIN